MAVEFIIPNVGDNVENVTIVNWLVEDGEEVDKEQDILEVETDKAVVPLPAPTTGYLHIGPYKAGDEVAVETVVAVIGSAEESFDSYSAEEASSDSQPKQAPSEPEDSSAPERTEAEPASNGFGAGVDDDGLRVTPMARKLAADLGVNLADVAGTGENGRITKADVRQAADKTPEFTTPERPATHSTPAQTETASSAPPKPSNIPPTPAENILDTVPLKGVRKIIAQRMGESVHTTARVTLIREVDATELVAFREQLKARYASEWGFAPGYNELLAIICANGLREYPYMNARMASDGSAIQLLKSVNVGMAVDTPRGLLVTVIRNTDKKNLQEIGETFRGMVERARNGSSPPDELSGGTFTISNLGMFDVDAFTPVINLPEVAILGVGRIVPKPVVRGDDIVVRKMWTLSLVFDHRLVDGAPAARFLQHIGQLIEDPEMMFITKR